MRKFPVRKNYLFECLIRFLDFPTLSKFSAIQLRLNLWVHYVAFVGNEPSPRLYESNRLFAAELFSWRNTVVASKNDLLIAASENHHCYSAKSHTYEILQLVNFVHLRSLFRKHPLLFRTINANLPIFGLSSSFP